MRHIVLDTEVFRRENLAFDSARFQRLAELVEENEIEIHLTDVTYEEVRRAIAEQVRIGMQTLRQEPIRRALNVIAHGAVPKLKELLGDIDESDIVTSLLKEFDDLLESLDANHHRYRRRSDEGSSRALLSRCAPVRPPLGQKARVSRRDLGCRDSGVGGDAS